MPNVAESQTLVDDIVRLRRAERMPAIADEISKVRAGLESRLGPTLSRSRASRILGVSQTALDRWVSLGEIPTLLTPNGRLEIPLQFVVEMAELIARLTQQGTDRRLLSAALKRRRRRAARIRESLPPHSPTTRSTPHGHRTAEKRSLAYHQVVAGRLNQQLVSEARRRLEELVAGGHIHARYAERWHGVLTKPIDQIAELITREDQEGRDLRQNSPFSGVLNEHERRQIIEAVR